MLINKKYPDAGFHVMILVIVINIIAYFIVGESSYYFQDLLSTQKQGTKFFSILEKWSMVLINLILLINFIPKMESIKNQKYLLLILCGICALLPITIGFFPFIYAISNVITFITYAWIQLFCPGTIRGAVVGILTASGGLLNIFDTYIENFRSFDVSAIHFTTVLMFFFAIGMAWRVNKISADFSKQNMQQEQIRLKDFVKRYLFIFISCVLIGINSGIFYFTYNDAILILPEKHPETFQYMVNCVSIIAPFVFGFISDRFGYMRTQMLSFYLITVVHFINFIVETLGLRNIFVLYFLSFLDCVFANSLIVTIVAICGFYFLKHGIFRSFAMYSILYNVGNFICALLFEKLTPSFAHYQVAITIINVLSLIAIYISFKKFQEQEVQI